METDDGLGSRKKICYDIVPVDAGGRGEPVSQSQSGDENMLFNSLATIIEKESIMLYIEITDVEGHGEPYSQKRDLVDLQIEGRGQPSAQTDIGSDTNIVNQVSVVEVQASSFVESYDCSANTTGGSNSFESTIDLYPAVEPIGFNLGIHGFDIPVEENNQHEIQGSGIVLPEIDDNDPVFEDPPPIVEDLVPSELEETLYVGREYTDISKFNMSLALYALERCFCYRIYKADPSRTIAHCSDPSCWWRVYASPDLDGIKYIIRTLVSEHTCGVQYRARFHEKATPRVLAELLKHHYDSGRKGPRACKIPDMFLHSHDLNVKYMKAWLAREVTMCNVKGGEEYNYKLLPKYLKILQKYNPGTITEMMKSIDSNGNTRFKYMFLAFGGSIYGYPFLRKVIVVNGTQSKGKYKRCLLTASCQDGNMQIFPLAFGIVNSENDKSWTWFLENLSKFVEDVDELVIISDRHSSIRFAVASVFPNAQHCCCIIHLCRNVKQKFKCEGLASVVSRAGRAFTQTEFDRWWHEIERRSPGCVSYLNEIGLPQWSHYHCEGIRYNLMSSNIAESVNATVKKLVDYPIVTMIEYVRTLLMSWFYGRRLLSRSSQQVCTPQVESLLIHNVNKGRHFMVKHASDTVYSVAETDGRAHTVDLEYKTCSCMIFNCYKIPCPHALAASVYSGGNIYDLVDKYYHRNVWASVYEKIIMSVPSLDANGKEVNTELLSARRPQKARILSAGETKNIGPYWSPRCGRCGLPGHNKSTCRTPLE